MLEMCQSCGPHSFCLVNNRSDYYEHIFLSLPSLCALEESFNESDRCLRRLLLLPPGGLLLTAIRLLVKITSDQIDCKIRPRCSSIPYLLHRQPHPPNTKIPLSHSYGVRQSTEHDDIDLLQCVCVFFNQTPPDWCYQTLCDRPTQMGHKMIKDVPSGESISNISRGDLSTVARAQLLADEVKQAAVFDRVSIVSFYCTTTYVKRGQQTLSHI